MRVAAVRDEGFRAVAARAALLGAPVAFTGGIIAPHRSTANLLFAIRVAAWPIAPLCTSPAVLHGPTDPANRKRPQPRLASVRLPPLRPSNPAYRFPAERPAAQQTANRPAEEDLLDTHVLPRPRLQVQALDLVRIADDQVRIRFEVPGATGIDDC